MAILLGLGVLSLLLAAETVIAIVLIGSPPTDIFVYPFRRFALVKILWVGNAWEAVRLLLVDKAVLIVERRDAATGTQAWGMFFFALNLLVHGAVAMLAGIGWVCGRLRKREKPSGLFALGALLLIFATSYVRLASCCGAAPGWVVDVWLLARAYDPVAAPGWQTLYQAVEPSFLFAQVLIATGGAVLLLRGWNLSQR